MTLAELSLTITISGATAVAASALAIWVGDHWFGIKNRKKIESTFDRTMEQYKSSLKHQTDLEIERMKSIYSLESIKFKYQFERLHEKRADAIAGVYERLVDLNSALGRYFAIFEPAGWPPKSERRAVAARAFEELDEYFPKKRIFVPEATAEKIERIRSTMINSFHKFLFSVEASGTNQDVWFSVFEELKGPLQGALRELEADFRSLLGDQIDID